MHGSRQLPGGSDEYFQLAAEDNVLNISKPVAEQALAEFPAALAAVRTQLGVPDGPVGLFGGSFGAGVAQLVLLESDVDVAALALVSPLIQLAGIVALNEQRFSVTYPWSDASRAVADRLDFLARSDEIIAKDPAVLIVVGAADAPGVLAPAERLWGRLSERYADPARVSLVTVPDMEHALAKEPGMEAAPQTPHAARVDAAVTAWFDKFLGSPK
jgi:pimeloyl-ACP methyl ester carboxylesterase